jgi:hypothetical protein
LPVFDDQSCPIHLDNLPYLNSRRIRKRATKCSEQFVTGKSLRSNHLRAEFVRWRDAPIDTEARVIT